MNYTIVAVGKLKERFWKDACAEYVKRLSRTEAETAIRDCRRHGSRDLHCYQCPYCGGWHLTHKA